MLLRLRLGQSKGDLQSGILLSQNRSGWIMLRLCKVCPASKLLWSPIPWQLIQPNLHPRSATRARRSARPRTPRSRTGGPTSGAPSARPACLLARSRRRPGRRPTSTPSPSAAGPPRTSSSSTSGLAAARRRASLPRRHCGRKAETLTLEAAPPPHQHLGPDNGLLLADNA